LSGDIGWVFDLVGNFYSEDSGSLQPKLGVAGVITTVRSLCVVGIGSRCSFIASTSSSVLGVFTMLRRNGKPRFVELQFHHMQPSNANHSCQVVRALSYIEDQV
jgi:hypothetical protein